MAFRGKINNLAVKKLVSFFLSGVKLRGLREVLVYEKKIFQGTFVYNIIVQFVYFYNFQ